MYPSWAKNTSCRICLKNYDHLETLDTYSTYFLIDVIFAVNKQLHEQADLPNRCCKQCLKELKICNDFKLKCEKSNETLVNFYQKLPALCFDLQPNSKEDNKDSINVISNVRESNQFCNTNLFEVGEPALDYKKNNIHNNECEAAKKKFTFQKEFSLEKEDLIEAVIDATLETKLKTLTVKENKVGFEFPDDCEIQITIKRPISKVDNKICPVCTYVAPYPSALIRHLRIHTKERPFSCEACSKTFSDMSTLNKHKFSHSDDAQYVCDVCGSSFTFRTSLVKHMAIHSEEKFECKSCKKSFNTKFNLDSHAKRHLKDGLFVCEICGKKRVSKYNLDIHKRVHSGNQQYPCKECSYKTVSKAGLRIHERTHSGEKPFVCTECEERFISSLQMRRHVIKNHRKNIIQVD